MERREAILQLVELTRRLRDAGVDTPAKFRETKKYPVNEAALCEILDYDRRSGMPAAHTLISADFHPTHPLVMYNYSSVAHNVLHEFPDGWTRALRQCRGIVFDIPTGLPRAVPFEKFFNAGEHPESTELPDEPWMATEKHDGHLGILFRADGNDGPIIGTTRGSFESPTSRLLNAEMIPAIAGPNNWSRLFPRETTVLVETIHPSTHVHRKYYGQRKLVLIGAYDVRTHDDYDHLSLRNLGKLLGLPVTRTKQGDSLDGLRAHMKDRSVRNREGWVARFESGRRVKFKYETYIGMMVASKLTHTYLMNRIMSGNLDEMLGTLDEELRDKARDMVAELKRVRRMRRPLKQRWSYLYGLVPPKKATPYFKQLCRTFVKNQCGG